MKKNASKQVENDLVYPYTIFHLDHQLLLKVERSQSANADYAEMIKRYRALMSNRPRVDMGLREHFRLGRKSLAETIEDIHLDNDGMAERKTTRKAASAIYLLKQGFYKPVAQVDAVCAQKAIMETISVNRLWMLQTKKHVKVLDAAWRSTESYDIVKRFDEYFLKMPLGFIDLKTRSYSSELV